MTTAIQTCAIVPRVDVFESAEGITIQAEMPGVNRESAQIDLNEGTLTLRGTRAVANGESVSRVRERARGEFVRSFSLGKGFDLGRIEAHMNDGVLTVTLPKSERLQRKTVSIN